MRQPALARSGSCALRCLCLTFALLAPSLTRAQSSATEPAAEAPKAGPPAEPKTQAQAQPGAATDKAASAPLDGPRTASEPAVAATSDGPAPQAEKAKESAPAFVDRDGDGIQDGQEHRFRHRRSAGKHRSGAGTDSGGVRARERAGQEDAQKQHPGGR